MAINNNYSRVRSHYGGYIGSIQVHSTPYIATINDPNAANFQEYVPAGYLKCDGSVKNASDFYALSQVLGVGQNSKFRKQNVDLREADQDTGSPKESGVNWLNWRPTSSDERRPRRYRRHR